MKVLFATDGSAHSRHAELLASKIPSLAAAEWTILTVVVPPILPVMGLEPMVAPMMTEEIQALFDAQMDSSKRILTDTQIRLNERGIQSETKMVEGDVGEEILALVDSEAYDTVVVGSRGLGGLESLMLGSVAKTLVHKCACSVLVGRRHQDQTIEDSIHRLEGAAKLKVAIGVDGSPGSDEAVGAVRNDGEGAYESVTVVAALPLSGIPTGLGKDDAEAAYASEEADVNAMLHERAQTLHGTAEHVISAHATAEPDAALMSYAQQHDLDVIVVGSARHGFLDRVVLGSSAGKIAAHAPCSVWIVRPSRY